METKYYFPITGGSQYLSLATHSGILTKEDIIFNIKRMIRKQYQENGIENPSNEELWNYACSIYWENPDRIDRMANWGSELTPISTEEAEDMLDEMLTINEWEYWELPEVEYDHGDYDYPSTIDKEEEGGGEEGGENGVQNSTQSDRQEIPTKQDLFNQAMEGMITPEEKALITLLRSRQKLMEKNQITDK